MDQLLVALDVDEGCQAERLADLVGDLVGGFKVGSRLFTAEGPGFVRRLVERGYRIFLDLKFHDLPSVVSGAVRAARDLGVWMVSVHAAGGAAMLEAARAAAGSARDRPLVVAVTVLTSLDDGDLKAIGLERTLHEQVLALARLAQASGADGVVASPREVRAVRTACGSPWIIVTPGIRAGAATMAGDDQARTGTGRDALEGGADYLVVGRPIIAAPDPRAAAEELVRTLARGDAAARLGG